MRRIKGRIGRIRRHLSLHTRLCAGFIFFTLIVSGLLWFVEVVLLEKTYYISKMREVETTAYSLADAMQSSTTEEFHSYLTSLSVGNQTCIEIIDGSGRVLYERDVMDRKCLLHGRENSVYYLLSNLASSETGTIRLRMFDEQINADTLVFGTLLWEGNTITGCILLNTPLEPVGSTVSLIKEVLKAFTILVLVIGMAISFYLSSRLSSPIVRLTRSAQRFANGDYTTRFEGGSYREVDELARMLTYAEDQISKVDTLQRDLVANVSHDLRTPLTMLKAYAEMIRDLSGDNPEKRNAHLQIIIEETDRLTMLVTDILDLSKLENGSIQLEKTTFDISVRMQDIITRYKGVSRKMGYHIRFTPAEPVEVTCDGGKIERVICNLIHNAINYTGEDKTIYVRQLNTPDGVRIEVEDTGDGIEEDKIDKIFDKYYRSENHKREVVGTGLGLTIVKAILKLHGYRYGVRSQLGKGSVFWFIIS